VALDLTVEIDRTIRNQGAQVHAALRAAIIDGRLVAGLKLPSSRTLANQLGVRRNAIVAAYEHLASDELIEARHGSGTFVALHLPAPTVRAPMQGFTPAQAGQYPFALGKTFVDAHLLRKFSIHLRRRVISAGAEDLGHGDPRGSTHLRAQLAHHLAVHRGVRCDPSCIVVVSGTQHALRLCVDALFSPGDAIWMEDPGYFATKTTLKKAGMQLIPVPVDTEGIDVAAGPRKKAKPRAAYVTPSHQFPTGVTMSMRRRMSLIDWARSTDAWVFEDDYDSEFRYSGPPLTALAGICGERVIYIGTFTKTLFAGLRLAYMVLPPALVEHVVAARAAFDRFPPGFAQDAIADLLDLGILARHTRRVRNQYRNARDVVVETLHEACKGSLLVQAPEQGLHLVAGLPKHSSIQAAAQIRKMAKSTLTSSLRRDSRGVDLTGLFWDTRDMRSMTSRLQLNALDVQRQVCLLESPGSTSGE
jgi:GntR family transcriptional regulator/MocR family aminotransferase